MKNTVNVTIFTKNLLIEYSKIYKEIDTIEDAENEKLIASKAICNFIKKNDGCLYRKIQSEAVFKLISENT